MLSLCVSDLCVFFLFFFCVQGNGDYKVQGEEAGSSDSGSGQVWAALDFLFGGRRMTQWM